MRITLGVKENSNLLPDLENRDIQPELMDDPELDSRRHLQALRGLARINSISGTVSRLWKPMRDLCDRSPTQPLRVLDMGCGGGDVLFGIWEAAKRENRSIEIGGVDFSRTATEEVSRKAQTLSIDCHLYHVDVLRDELPHDWDVIYCSLFMHHFSNDEAESLLGKMKRVAKQMVLVDDLNRSLTGYLLCWWGVRILSRSPIVHHDGPVSVKAAFRSDEAIEIARRAGMEEIEMSHHWPQRFLLKWQPS